MGAALAVAPVVVRLVEHVALGVRLVTGGVGRRVQVGLLVVRVVVGPVGMTSRLRSGTRGGTTRAIRDATRSRDSCLTATTVVRVVMTVAALAVTTVRP
jgi:hypothetical protein